MSERARLKKELAALGRATEAGFDAGGPATDRIRALAAALEAINPEAEPARANDRLKGRWRMLYSSFGLQRRTTLARLSFNLLPKTPVTVLEVFQVRPAHPCIDRHLENPGRVFQHHLSRRLFQAQPRQLRHLYVLEREDPLWSSWSRGGEA